MDTTSGTLLERVRSRADHAVWERSVLIYTADGQWALTGGSVSDQTARLWRLAKPDSDEALAARRQFAEGAAKGNDD